jgi:hypothetical protein
MRSSSFLLLLAFAGCIATTSAGPGPTPVGGHIAVNEDQAVAVAATTQTCTGACSLACPQGGCSFSCGAGATCDLSCVGGGCVELCASGSICNAACEGGRCNQQCSNATCNLSCEGTGCAINGAAASTYQEAN